MLEKEVITALRHKLDGYKMSGIVVWFDRIQSGQVRLGRHFMRLAAPGTPDYIAVIRNKSGGLHLLFLECKGNRGQLRDTQIAFREKYQSIKDVSYHVISDVKELSLIMDTFGLDTLENIKWP